MSIFEATKIKHSDKAQKGLAPMVLGVLAYKNHINDMIGIMEEGMPPFFPSTGGGQVRHDDLLILPCLCFEALGPA
jgi:hypothetical protein